MRTHTGEKLFQCVECELLLHNEDDVSFQNMFQKTANDSMAFSGMSFNVLISHLIFVMFS